jgi:branched-chain amino acid transport system permease protein
MKIPNRLEQLVPRFWPLAVLLVLVTLSSLIGFLGAEVIQREVTLALIYLILVVSLSIFTGNSGVFSFGHISFMAIGAYATGLLTLTPTTKAILLTEAPKWIQDAHLASTPAILVGGAIAALFALLISIPLMRLSGIVATLATFAVLNVVFVVGDNWTQVTGGSAGLTGVPTETTVGRALIWALLAVVVAFIFQSSRTGLRLQASREDEVAARSIGTGVHTERRIAFVVSAFLTGVAGGLYAQFIGSFNAPAFYLTVTFLSVVMIVVGGIKSLAGAVLGTIFISFVSALLLRAERGVDVFGIVDIPGRPGVREVILAVIMLSILILRPSGITGGREITWPFGSRAILATRPKRPAAPDGNLEAPAEAKA